MNTPRRYGLVGLALALTLILYGILRRENAYWMKVSVSAWNEQADSTIGSEVPEELEIDVSPSIVSGSEAIHVPHQEPVELSTKTFHITLREGEGQDASVQEALLSLGLRQVASPLKADIVFSNDIHSIEQESSWVSLITSPCINGNIYEQRECLEDYVRSLLLIPEKVSIGPKRYYLNNFNDCIDAFQRNHRENLMTRLIRHDPTDSSSTMVHVKLGELGEVLNAKRADIETRCEELRGSFDVVEFWPIKPERTIRIPILIARLNPLIVLIDKKDGTKVRHLPTIVRVIGNAVRRRLAETLRGHKDPRVFQFINIVLVHDSSSNQLILQTIDPQVQLPKESWIHLLHVGLRLWSGIEVDDDDHVMIVRNAVQLPTYDTVDDLVKRFSFAEIKKRAIASCDEGSISFGSKLSCADLDESNAPNKGQQLSKTSSSTPLVGKSLFRYDERHRVCGVSSVLTPLARLRAQALGMGYTFPRCSGVVTWGEADAFCKSAGARLCTIEEIVELQLVAGTGCDGDKSRVWTMTMCSKNSISYLTAPGQKVKDPNTFPIKCIPADTQKYPPAIARCCANDGPPGCRSIQKSKLWNTTAITRPRSINCTVQEDNLSDLTCAELRFRYPSEARNQIRNTFGHRVCSRMFGPRGLGLVESDYPITQRPTTSRVEVTAKADFVLASYDFVSSLCMKMGARLCKASEISQQTFWAGYEASASRQSAWTSDRCDNNDVQVASFASGVRCVNPSIPSNRYLALCCADEYSNVQCSKRTLR